MTANWVRQAPGELHRFEACFSGFAYEPHRHDSYTVAITLQGVQSFGYRGRARHSLPGNALILHPDELHDGHAGTDSGFRYRAAAVEPRLIQHLLGGRALPFVDDVVSTDIGLLRAARTLLGDFERSLDPLECHDALYDLAAALSRLAGHRRRAQPQDYAACERVRTSIQDACLRCDFSLAELERIGDCDRWQLSRDFRALYGTSPYRYLVLRRLEHARRMVESGMPLAEVAAACRFSDQSHLTRHFRNTYGTTPGRWSRYAAAARSFYKGAPRRS